MTTIYGRKDSAVAISVVMLISVAFLCGTVVGFPIAVNQRRLAAFSQSLQAYPIPPGARTVDSGALVVNLGNGNTCWYEAWVDIESTLTTSAMEAYYRGVEIPSIEGSWQNVVSIEVEALGSGSTPGSSLFRVKIWDHSENETFDLRCH